MCRNYFHISEPACTSADCGFYSNIGSEPQTGLSSRSSNAMQSDVNKNNNVLKMPSISVERYKTRKAETTVASSAWMNPTVSLINPCTPLGLDRFGYH